MCGPGGVTHPGGFLICFVIHAEDVCDGIHANGKGLSLLVRSAYMLTRRRTSRLWLERRPGSVLSAMLSYGWRLLWGTKAFRPAVQ